MNLNAIIALAKNYQQYQPDWRAPELPKGVEHAGCIDHTLLKVSFTLP